MRLLIFIIIAIALSVPAFAMSGIGTALEKGKLEIDAAVNPSKTFDYGQNYLFIHYGLGNGYEINGYLSKFGTVYDWHEGLSEWYAGILKQWYYSPLIDLGTVLGVRRRTAPGEVPSLFGPGIYYTFKLNPVFKIGGHVQYIGSFQDGTIKPLNNGFSTEIGFYYKFNPRFEFAIGAYSTTTLRILPNYTFNFYL